MVEFDDVIAMDASDDWDDYDATGSVPAVTAEPALTLHVPGAVVECFGEPSPELVTALSDLMADRSTTTESGGFSNDEPVVRHALGDPTDIERTADEVLEQLRQADRHHVRLAASLVLPGGDAASALLLVHPDPVVRHHLTAELIARGAAFVTADDTVLTPGTRTVQGAAFPLRQSARGTVVPSALAMVEHHATIGTVVLVDTGDGAPGTDELEPQEALAAWISEEPALIDRYGPGVLDVLVAATAGARFVSVRADSVEDYVDAVVGATERDPLPRPTVLLHRFDPATAGEGTAAVGGPMRGLRAARIGDAGIVVDGASGTSVALEPSEIDALEALATAASKRPPDAPAERRLQRVADLGVDLSVIVGRPSEAEAFALPNSALATSSTAGPARANDTAAVAVLEDVMVCCEELGIDPVLFGSLLTAYDSGAPSGAVEVNRVDILVGRNELDPLMDALHRAGYTLESGLPDEDEDRGPLSVTVVPPALVGTSTPVPLSIHAVMSVGHFSELVDHDELQRRALPVLVGTHWCRALHPLDRFVQTCVRYQQHNPDQRVAREVVLSAPRLEPAMVAALEVSDAWGTTRDLLAAIRRVDEALPGISPWLVERATRYDTDRRARRGRSRGR